MTESEVSLQRAYGLIRRSGLRPLLKEASAEEKPWLTILSVLISHSKDKIPSILQIVAQPTVTGENNDCSGNVILFIVSTKGDKITILSGDEPRVISGLENGALKQEVLNASQSAAENPGIFMFDADKETLTLIYQETKRRTKTKIIQLSVDKLVEE
jgi:hypothetical protein